MYIHGSYGKALTFTKYLSEFSPPNHVALRNQARPKEGITLVESYSGDGIGTFNPILGTGLDS